MKVRPDFHRYNYLASYFIRINVTRKPFDDARVRRALALAVDKQRIVNKITRAEERVASHLVPPDTAHYQSPEGLGYDPVQARRLMSEAGFADGKGFPRFQFTFNTHRIHERIAVELQAMWQRELGIEMDVRQLEWKAYFRAQTELDYDLCRSSWVGDYNDPNTFLDMFMSDNPNNRTGWKSAKYDGFMRHANSLTDVKERARLLHDAEKLLIADDAPIVPIYIYNGFGFWDPTKISGLYLNIRDEHPVHAIRRLAPRTNR